MRLEITDGASENDMTIVQLDTDSFPSVQYGISFVGKLATGIHCRLA